VKPLGDSLAKQADEICEKLRTVSVIYLIPPRCAGGCALFIAEDRQQGRAKPFRPAPGSAAWKHLPSHAPSVRKSRKNALDKGDFYAWIGARSSIKIAGDHG